MKKLFILSILFCATKMSAQFQELNAGIGSAYYYGDLNTTDAAHAVALFGESFDMKNFKMSYSLGYRYNFKDRFSIGLNFYHMYLSGYDSDNNDPTGTNDPTFFRKYRNLSFFTTVNEGFVDLKFEPFRTDKKWNTSKKWLLSPYVGAGVGFFKFNPKTMYNGQEVELQPLGTEGQGLAGYGNKYNLFELVIPVSLGVKFVESERRYSISLDFNYNHTFTDYLDDVSTKYANPADITAAYSADKAALVNALANRSVYGTGYEFIAGAGQQRGQSNHNDFFLTSQLKFSYYIFNKNQDAYYRCCGY